MVGFLFLALLAVSAVKGGVIDDDLTHWEALENPDLFEGDILGIESPEDLNAIPYDHQRWPGGRVPYIIDNSLTFHKSSIDRAMQHYHGLTCIRFVPRSTERNYIKIFSGKGCYSNVGTLNRGEQPVSLGPGCINHGIIVHELGHAIGFFHEQNRSDRDKYLIIYWENIKPGMENQFFKLQPHQNRLLSEFDYNSIMLYGEKSFSKDRIAKTMIAKNSSIRLKEAFEKPGLAASDIKRIKLLYKC